MSPSELLVPFYTSPRTCNSNQRCMTSLGRAHFNQISATAGRVLLRYLPHPYTFPHLELVYLPPSQFTHNTAHSSLSTNRVLIQSPVWSSPTTNAIRSQHSPHLAALT